MKLENQLFPFVISCLYRQNRLHMIAGDALLIDFINMFAAVFLHSWYHFFLHIPQREVPILRRTSPYGRRQVALTPWLSGDNPEIHWWFHRDRIPC